MAHSTSLLKMPFQKSKLRPFILSFPNIIALSLIVLVIVFLVFGLTTRKNKIKDGVYKKDYPAGAQEITYKNGKKNGPFKVYWPTGKIHIALNYVNGIPQGPVNHYYESGQLASEGNAAEGLNDGLFKRYSPTGELLQEDLYQKGVLLDQDQRPFAGTRKEFFEYPGWQENTYKDGRKDGVSKTFSPDGEVMFERQFNGGTVAAYRAVSQKMKGPREWTPIPSTWTGPAE